MDSSFLIVFGVLLVAAVARFWLIPRLLGHRHAERLPGWTYPITIPIVVILSLRFGQGNKGITTGYYIFGAVLGAVAGVFCWMARRQKLASVTDKTRA